MERLFILTLSIATLAAAGCNSRPRAPALLDNAVYQNDQEGFRMQVPEGWVVHAKTVLPAGQPVAKEKMLVGYKRPHGKRLASFEVACVDLPADADLAAQLIGKRRGPGAWRQVGPALPATVGDQPATRLAFVQAVQGEELRKEVVAVRRGGRVFFFVLVAAPDDAPARDDARRIVASVTWRQ